MLEDDFTWVIRKALKGLELAPNTAARLSGLSETDVLSLTRGNFNPETAARLASVLGLNPSALATHDQYQPTPLTLEGVTRLDLPFESERVNVWLIRKENSTLLIDTGYEASSPASEIHPDLLLITHAHRDHIGGLPALLARGTPAYGPHIEGTLPLQPGERLELGPLEIIACDLSGHATPSLGYHIHGLAAPVLVTGDALFAGSIGGCPDKNHYHHALERLRDELSPLPGSTVILPGHGPATTLAEERQRNPFPLF